MGTSQTVPRKLHLPGRSIDYGQGRTEKEFTRAETALHILRTSRNRHVDKAGPGNGGKRGMLPPTMAAARSAFSPDAGAKARRWRARL